MVAHPSSRETTGFATVLRLRDLDCCVTLAKTRVKGILIPEHRISGVLYVVTRPILGVPQDVVSRAYLTRHRDAMRLA